MAATAHDADRRPSRLLIALAALWLALSLAIGSAMTMDRSPSSDTTPLTQTADR